jgi:SAM-dependent methyltransferase/ribosomal protein S18 acetylase RimI-like enzyme/uncharacterized protein YbaR (Trm112 family)
LLEQLLEAEILVCPYCVKQYRDNNNINLRLINERIEGGDIKDGGLLCNNCSRSYPIIEGVIVFPTHQGAAKYDQAAVVQNYIQTQYRDILRSNKDLSEKLKENDATGFFLELSTGQLSSPMSNYYLELIELLGDRITPESLALDLGCSVGRLSRYLAHKANLVIGVDPSFAQIKIARELLLTGYAAINLGQFKVSGSGIKGEEVLVKLEDEYQSNVDFIVADAALLPFRYGAFDVICSSSVIERVPDAEDFIKNIERISHDGTTLLITSPFDWSDKYSPKEKWLGFKAFGTSEGVSEEALKELLRHHHFRLLEKRLNSAAANTKSESNPSFGVPANLEQNIPWVTLSDRRHHSVWSVYSAVFENYSYRIKQLDPCDGIPKSLIEVYQRVFREDPAFHEVISYENARDAFTKMDLLFIAERVSDGQPIGFAGGRNIDKDISALENYVRIKRNKDEARYKKEVTASQKAARKALKELSNERIFYINELGVLKEYEGAGIGGRLLDTLIGYARASGYHSFTLVTSYKSDKAISLYQRRKFSFLSNVNGLLRRPVEEMRISGKKEREWRPYLYRVDEFVRISNLKNGKNAFLELIRPASIRHDGFTPMAQKISELYGRAFWNSESPSKRWRVEGILSRIPNIDLLILAFDESYEAIGYSMFTRIKWRNDSVLFINAVALSGGTPKHKENWQKSGLGIVVLREALRQLPSKILAARTQNPAFVSLLRKLMPKQVQPFDDPYSSDTLDLLNTLRTQISELSDGKMGPSPGIYKHVYKGGLLGNYEEKLPKKELSRFDNIMTKLDRTWKRKKGDAMIPLAIDTPEIDEAF